MVIHQHDNMFLQTKMLATDQWSQLSKVCFTYAWPFVWILLGKYCYPKMLQPVQSQDALSSGIP